MPLPLIPLVVVGAVGVGLTTGDEHEVPGAVPHPDVAPAQPEARPPPRPYVPPAPQTVRAGGDPPPADPAMSVVEAGVGKAEEVVKTAVVGAGAVVAGTIAEGGTIGEGIAAGVQSVGSSASSAASGAAGITGPAIVVAADAVMVAGAIFTMFGGDPEDIFGHTYATTPQLDATTPLGQAAARAQAPLLRASLETQGTKFGFKGERDPADTLLG